MAVNLDREPKEEASQKENLDKLSQEVGYTLPSGAGAKSDQVAAKLLQAYGDQALQATAKYHFANTKKAYQRSK